MLSRKQRHRNGFPGILCVCVCVCARRCSWRDPWVNSWKYFCSMWHMFMNLYNCNSHLFQTSSMEPKFGDSPKRVARNLRFVLWLFILIVWLYSYKSRNAFYVFIDYDYAVARDLLLACLLMMQIIITCLVWCVRFEFVSECGRIS